MLDKKNCPAGKWENPTCNEGKKYDSGKGFTT